MTAVLASHRLDYSAVISMYASCSRYRYPEANLHVITNAASVITYRNMPYACESLGILRLYPSRSFAFEAAGTMLRDIPFMLID